MEQPLGRTGRISVCCRVRPLLESEILQGVHRAAWTLSDTSVVLRERPVRDPCREDGMLSRTRSEIHIPDHSRRDDYETAMDAVFNESTTTGEIYEKFFREIVGGSTEGLNGAILAYGQTSSGKTFSINGSTSRTMHEDGVATKGIIHFALEDLFSQIRMKAAAAADNAAGGSGPEYLVRMSYCELYMERVNDLLRKISPQSQNLPVKEDPENHCFYVEGIKEKIVRSAEEVVVLLAQAEKRRRVAHTKYNEVSSRSHTLLTLCVECVAPLEAYNGCAEVQEVVGSVGDEPRITKVGRLVIVDLAGNERIEAGSEYMAESNSINKSLFFLGKVIEKLSNAERRHADDSEVVRNEHVPYRDSKLTRLLSVHLGGNSQTGVLVTMTPAEEFVEQSLSTLRFAKKASTVRCTAKPVLISKEHSLIIKQREIISQLHQQVRELKEAQMRQSQQMSCLHSSSMPCFSREPAPLPQPAERPHPVGQLQTQHRAASLPEEHTPRPQYAADSELTAERQQRVAQLQSLTLGSDQQCRQQFVSKSREVDAVVLALIQNKDSLRRQKATVLDELRELYGSVTKLGQEVVKVTEEIQSSDDGNIDTLVEQALVRGRPENGPPLKTTEKAVQDLRNRICGMLLAVRLRSNRVSTDQENTRSRVLVHFHGARRAGEGMRMNVSHSPTRKVMESPPVSTRPSSGETDSSRFGHSATLRRSSSMSSASATSSSAFSSILGSATLPRESHTPPPQATLHEEGTCAAPGAQVLGHWRNARSATPRVSVLRKEENCGLYGLKVPPRSNTGPWHSLLREGDMELRSYRSSDKSLLAECEPIVECRAQDWSRPLKEDEPFIGGGTITGQKQPGFPQMHLSESPPPPLQSRWPPAPPKPQDLRPVSEFAPRLTMDYFRKLGIRTSWHPGDVAYWRGQPCTIVKVVTEEQPLYVVLRTPSGSEVTTDLCLLSEGPPMGRSVSVETDNMRPLRLAPLGEHFSDALPGQQTSPGVLPGNMRSMSVPARGAIL